MINTRKNLILSAMTLSSFSYSQAIFAQDKPTQKDEQAIEKLVITANPLEHTILESALPVSIIAGDDLKSRVAPTLGETLKNVPGVHSTYFGPVSSSPIIRGLDGPRVKVLQNGLDVSDASRIGPDHIVSTETANATQIEVLRGPATLIYGSGALGGVVNIVDKRLPTETVESLEGQASYSHDTVSSENLVNISLDGGAGKIAWHFDAFDRKTKDYEIPGEAVRHEEHDEEEEHEEHEEEESNSGVLENSFIDAQGYSAGIGWVGDNTKFAVSFGNLESDYGIPGHSHGDEHGEEHDEEHEGEEVHMEAEEESIFGQLNQDRYQALLDFVDLDGFFSEIRFRNAYTDYTHSEIEDGEVGTTFSNESLESRLYAKHRTLNGWDGVVGINYLNSDFSALGEEAFTPASETDTWALFVLEEKRFGQFMWQLGGRVERVDITPDNEFFRNEDLTQPDFSFAEESFTASSYSAGLVWTPDDTHVLSINVARSERAPTAAEIFSNGLHIATETFELGAGFDILVDGEEYEIVQSQRAVNKERSTNLDITYHFNNDFISSSVSVYYNKFNDYLYQRNTGLLFEEEEHEEEAVGEEHAEEHHEEGLPIFIFAQQDAEIRGFEAELDIHLSDSLRIETYADLTRATLKDGSNLPRIPPFRLGAELHWESQSWHAELGASYYAKQDKIAEFETPTDSYTLVNAAFNYYLDMYGKDTVLFIKGNNLTDREARVHSSFIKDTAPLPGRSFVLGARVNF